jgi:hypothetical protein
MVVNEGPPILVSATRGLHRVLVALNGPFADVDAQLQQFAPHALGTPQAIFPVLATRYIRART